MKNYFARTAIFAALCFITLSSNAQNCCTDYRTQIKNNYCSLGTANSPYRAGLSIDKFDVTKDGAGHLLLNVRVKNRGNQDAWETRLIILLPSNICSTKVNNMRVNDIPVEKKFNLHGGQIEFCIGHLTNAPDSSTFSVTIQTDTVFVAWYKSKKTFAGFVYSSTPDDFPLDNYSAWINEGVRNPADLNSDPAKLVNLTPPIVKRGF